MCDRVSLTNDNTVRHMAENVKTRARYITKTDSVCFASAIGTLM